MRKIYNLINLFDIDYYPCHLCFDFYLEKKLGYYTFSCSSCEVLCGIKMPKKNLKKNQ
ncbi:MAG TPA: hypothetical protein VMZ91_09155 [Candidatus Paceibacterota bacterium]|nr:hypothetical protein [Candidatus Paceibacterota bacterium]